MTAEEKYLVLFSSFVPFGPARTDLLLKFFGGPKNTWKANRKDLLKTGLPRKLVEKFIDHKKRFDESAYFDKLNKLKINVIFDHQKKYPTSLKQIKSHPKVLYIKGKYIKTDENAVAIIGSRQMTSYGKEVASSFSKELAGLGVTIVSGMARGIDSEAHKGALEASGRTIAVLGSGLDYIYPPENTNLSEKIAKNGCLVSEYPLGYPVFPYNFAARNRIISALARVVVVVEGKKKSGTFLTVGHALDQGKTVFAVPGQINSPMSKAPLFLIKEGALMATSVQDILDEL